MSLENIVAIYPEVETYVAPFRGWRMWSIAAHIGLSTDLPLAEWRRAIAAQPPRRLRSLYHFGRTIWPVRKPLCRECLCDKKDVVEYHHTCGIYAFRDLPSLVPHLIMNLADAGKGQALEEDSILVIGEVNLWGDVYIHEKGYRAEYAYPESVYFIEGFGRNPLNEEGIREYGIGAQDVLLFDLLTKLDEATVSEMYARICTVEKSMRIGILDAAFRAVKSEFPYGLKRRGQCSI